MLCAYTVDLTVHELLTPDKQTDSQTDRQADSQTDRQTDSQTVRQSDRQTVRQTDTHTLSEKIYSICPSSSFRVVVLDIAGISLGS